MMWKNQNLDITSRVTSPWLGADGGGEEGRRQAGAVTTPFAGDACSFSESRGLTIESIRRGGVATRRTHDVIRGCS